MGAKIQNVLLITVPHIQIYMAKHDGNEQEEPDQRSDRDAV
jgi:hypothetical protein